MAKPKPRSRSKVTAKDGQKRPRTGSLPDYFQTRPATKDLLDAIDRDVPAAQEKANSDDRHLFLLAQERTIILGHVQVGNARDIKRDQTARGRALRAIDASVESLSSNLDSHLPLRGALRQARELIAHAPVGRGPFVVGAVDNGPWSAKAAYAASTDTEKGDDVVGIARRRGWSVQRIAAVLSELGYPKTASTMDSIKQAFRRLKTRGQLPAR